MTLRYTYLIIVTLLLAFSWCSSGGIQTKGECTGTSLISNLHHNNSIMPSFRASFIFDVQESHKPILSATGKVFSDSSNDRIKLVMEDNLLGIVVMETLILHEEVSIFLNQSDKKTLIKGNLHRLDLSKYYQDFDLSLEQLRYLLKLWFPLPEGDFDIMDSKKEGTLQSTLTPKDDSNERLRYTFGDKCKLPKSLDYFVNGKAQYTLYFERFFGEDESLILPKKVKFDYYTTGREIRVNFKGIDPLDNREADGIFSIHLPEEYQLIEDK